MTAKFDNGTVTVAKIGQAFPGVAAAYPSIVDNDKVGSIFAVSALPPGAHSLTVEHRERRRKAGAEAAVSAEVIKSQKSTADSRR